MQRAVDDLDTPDLPEDPEKLEPFYVLFGTKSAFDRTQPQERRIPKMSDATLAHLNQSSRKVQPRPKCANPQTTTRPRVSVDRGPQVKREVRNPPERPTSSRRSIPSRNLIPDNSPKCATTPLKRDIAYVLETPQVKTCPIPDPAETERRNRRRLNEFMKAHTGDSVSEWDSMYQPGPRPRKAYHGPQPRKKGERRPGAFIERDETRACALRKQAARQSIARREAEEEMRREGDREYDARVREITLGMKPYLKFLDDLEKPKPIVYERWEEKRRETKERAKSLKSLVDSAKKSPSLLFHNAVELEIQSLMNKEKRQEENERTRKEQEEFEQRGRYNKILYELTS